MVELMLVWWSGGGVVVVWWCGGVVVVEFVATVTNTKGGLLRDAGSRSH